MVQPTNGGLIFLLTNERGYCMIDELAELREQRGSIQESLCEAIIDGDGEGVAFFKRLLEDIEGAIKAISTFLAKPIY